MNRSTAREFVAPGTSVATGEVLVATEIGDPVRGPLPGPAAPLVGGSLLRKGVRVRYAPVAHCADPGHDGGGATVFVATCAQRDGSTAAIAAAASAADRVAVAAAKSAVDEWSAVAGTRRLVAAGSPWCSGATQALAEAGRAVADRRTVHVYGQLAAGTQAISALAAQGAVFVTSLDEVPDGEAVIFPAHGVSAEVQAEAAARELEVIDATCPLVAGVHAEARTFAGRGDDLVLIGQAGDAAAAGTWARRRAGPRWSPPRRARPRCACRIRSGFPTCCSRHPGRGRRAVAAALRSRFPALHGRAPTGSARGVRPGGDHTRGRVSVRRDARPRLLRSPDTRHICGLARDCGAKTHVVGEPATSSRP